MTKFINMLQQAEVNDEVTPFDKAMQVHYSYSRHISHEAYPMSNSVLTLESTLTDRFQTTIPGGVRKAMHLKKREKIRYTLQPDGSVVLSRADVEADPVLDGFLEFLAKDMQQHPARIQPISQNLVSRIHELVGDNDVDLDAPLDEVDD